MLRCNDEWTTARVPHTRAIDYWNEVLTENVIELNVRSDVPRGFGGHIAATPLADQAAFLISARHNQHAVHAGRTPRADHFVLIHMRSGHIDLSTRARSARLNVGDIVLLSAAEAYRFESPARTSSLVLQFGHAWLKRRLPLVDDCIGRRVDGQQGWGRTLSSALWNIEPAASSAARQPPAGVADQVAGLLTLALEPQRATGRGDGLLARIHDVMRHRFDDPALGPGDVAAAVGISKRYLHQLCAGSGATFNQHLFGLRIDHACRLLGNAANDALTITEIAFACGFADASYFSRVFRQRLQLTPSEYRRTRGSRPAAGTTAQR